MNFLSWKRKSSAQIKFFFFLKGHGIQVLDTSCPRAMRLVCMLPFKPVYTCKFSESRNEKPDWRDHKPCDWMNLEVPIPMVSKKMRPVLETNDDKVQSCRGNSQIRWDSTSEAVITIPYVKLETSHFLHWSWLSSLLSCLLSLKVVQTMKYSEEERKSQYPVVGNRWLINPLVPDGSATVLPLTEACGQWENLLHDGVQIMGIKVRESRDESMNTSINLSIHEENLESLPIGSKVFPRGASHILIPNL